MKKTPVKSQADLLILSWLFLRLGLVSFGGPAAHIALMRETFVQKKKWLSEEDFLDHLSATNFIPGPNSTELAMHIGHLRAGRLGLVVAGLSFILPAALLVLILAHLYVTFGYLPSAQAAFSGIKPVILAIIFQALWSMSKTALKSKQQMSLAALAFFANYFGLDELTTIAAVGLVSFIFERTKEKSFLGLFMALPSTAAVSSVAAFSQLQLFWFFLKVGSVLFGSGYVLIAYLRTELVEKLHWLSETQLLDAVAIGQLTPGPVFTTATFIGYLVGGKMGATLATIGIFLPAFVFVFLSAPWIPKLRQSKALASVLNGVNAGSLAVMTVTMVHLAKSSLTDGLTITLSSTALFILLKWRVNSAWLIAGGALAGFLSQ